MTEPQNQIDQSTADFIAEYDALVKKHGYALGAYAVLSPDGRIVPILQVTKVEQKEEEATAQ